MAYILNIKSKAIRLRKRGYSLQEVSEFLKVSKSTLSLWLRGISISSRGKKRLTQRVAIIQGLNASRRKERTRNLIDSYIRDFQLVVKNIPLSQNVKKLLCAVIYWCEGVKDVYSGLRFTNSDPKLVKVFLSLLRSSFKLDESKFRICVHLHSYHNQEVEQQFWSTVTGISRKQFIKPFQKKNSGGRIREGYRGCVSIRYHDTRVARLVMAMAQAFLQSKGV